MQVSFLSLNLNTLNEQLAKVDLAQRLFIEPDVLPPELVSRVQLNIQCTAWCLICLGISVMRLLSLLCKLSV